MKILSWDVGIYNLSYCILERDDNDHSNVKIIDWDIVNLVDNEDMKKNIKKNINILFENIPRKLHELPQLLDVDIVVIENQPSLKNPKMKSIQMILYSYFIILGKVIGNDNNSSYIDKIDFCSASNKLKVYDGPEIILSVPKKRISKVKSDETVKLINVVINEENNEKVINETSNNYNDESKNDESSKNDSKKKKASSIKYADKKKLAIAHAQYFLQYQDTKYLDFFNSHKKKDDLSDSFLQGLYWLKNIK